MYSRNVVVKMINDNGNWRYIAWTEYDRTRVIEPDTPDIVAHIDMAWRYVVPLPKNSEWVISSL